MEVKITNKELEKLFKEKILEYLKKTVDDNMFEFWVRDQVNKILAKDLIEDLKKTIDDKKLHEMLQNSVNTYIQDKFSKYDS